jgi:hypothetical protein
MCTFQKLRRISRAAVFMIQRELRWPISAIVYYERGTLSIGSRPTA